MSAPGTDAVGMLRWGLRRYALLFLACLVVGAVVAPFAAARLAAPADAEALVLAQRLDMSLNALPRYGEAVFGNGAVTEAVASKYGSRIGSSSVIPDKVSLVDEQDSIVLHVIGHDPDPKIAAGIANTAAGAFVTALNGPGVGVGNFVLQSPAVPPQENSNAISNLIAVPMGLGAGIVLGLAAVLGLLVARRPVIDEAAVEEITGVRALGTVVVPRTRRGHFARPDKFPGLVPVCRRLLRLPTSTVVMLSRRRDGRIRRQLTVALATVLMRIRDVALIAPDEMVARAHAGNGNVGPHPALPDGLRAVEDPGTERIRVVDSSDPMDLVQPPALTVTVLVARLGISSAALRAAVVEHLGGSAEAGIVLVKRGRRTSGEPEPRFPDAPSPAKDVALVEG